MKNILVTGVGGGVGQSILKALDGSTYRAIAVDAEELACGLQAAPVAYKGHYADAPQFIDRLLHIAQREACELLFPGHDVELPPLAAHADRFLEIGTIPVVSSPEVIRTCDDKMKTIDFLRQHGFPVPETKLLSQTTCYHDPVVLKPQRGGARSKNTYIAHSAEEFELFSQLVDIENCVAQEFIEGDEYTCGSVTFDGKCYGAIVMRRILRDGDTYKAFVEHPSWLEEVVRNAVEALRPFGACNIQLRVRDKKAYIFEINARCSGTTAARSAAGFNEPLMIADYLLRSEPPNAVIKPITVLRYWKELIACNENLDTLRRGERLDGDGSCL